MALFYINGGTFYGTLALWHLFLKVLHGKVYIRKFQKRVSEGATVPKGATLI